MAFKTAIHMVVSVFVLVCLLGFLLWLFCCCGYVSCGGGSGGGAGF